MADPKRKPKEKPKAIPISQAEVAELRAKDPLARHGRLVSSAPDRLLLPPPTPKLRPTPASLDPQPLTLGERSDASRKKEAKQKPITRSLNDYSFMSRLTEPDSLDLSSPEEFDSDKSKLGERKSLKELRREKFQSAGPSRTGSQLSTLSEKTGSPTILSLLSERISNLSIGQPLIEHKEATPRVKGPLEEERREGDGSGLPDDGLQFAMDQDPEAAEDDEDYS
jgi:hypothetical protein